jgi:hypothetical protein
MRKPQAQLQTGFSVTKRPDVHNQWSDVGKNGDIAVWYDFSGRNSHFCAVGYLK